MKLRFVAKIDVRTPAPVAVIGLFEGDRALPAPLAALKPLLGDAVFQYLKSARFKGEENEWQEITPAGGKFERVFVLGLGKRTKLTLDRTRRFAGTTQKRMDAAKVPQYVSYLGATLEDGPDDAGETYEALAEGMVLASYHYRGMKTEKAPKRVEDGVLFVPKGREKFARRGQTIARGTMLARDVISAPANLMTPTLLADVAQKMCKEQGIKVTVWNKARCERERMHLLLGVSQGSVEEPRFVVMEYGKAVKGKGPLVLVGKGITFDTGGISMKPAVGMEQMKYDMSGAGAVIGAMHNIAALRLKGHFVGVFAAAENMPSGTATKPGDVHKSRDGKTVEIINTDAEGRLVLADALAYVTDLKPSAVIDNATLTGACVIALGHAIGAMGNNGPLMAAVRAAAERAGERMWELPMWDEYGKDLKSQVADLKNITGGRGAGTISAAKFLEKFTDYPWVHLDIAGAAWEEKDHPYVPKGAVGAAVRTFTRVAEKWFA